jgi:primosomal protein N' (replication factor Y)
LFADVIADISHDSVDRAFEYIIPEELAQRIKRGSRVKVPFGRSDKLIDGFVINIKEKAAWDAARLKSIHSIEEESIFVEDSLIELADFIKTNYGGTMNRALKTVLPVKKAAAPVTEKYIYLAAEEAESLAALERFTKDKRSVAKLRLMNELVRERVLPCEIVSGKLNISPSTIKSLEKEGLIGVDVRTNLRDAISPVTREPYTIVLNEDQRSVADSIWSRYEGGDMRPSLIRGVTGSGKTEIYINLIDRIIKQGKQAIVLIPEIALTYQTVMRFYKKFGDRISVINSKLSPAQRHDQIEKAKKGQVDIIIGPRSALFAPFANLGIIIIDEEHEGTYKNENVPRYHSREVAIKRAQLAGGIVVMGSATPSVESYYKAKQGEYALYTLERRAEGAALPQVHIVDLREELASGNRSMVSRKLQKMIAGCLARSEQVMLFINRRGYSSFVSCRSCGEAIKCRHCDVSLKYHKNGKLMCHYCGYEMPMVKICPSCGSTMIGTFGTGTQKVEEEINKLFPEAVILRMDYDTTRKKDGHEKILSAFANRQADILIGTQMIVKGHDFENVTLVGIMAADLSLYSDSYQAPERTFQLLTQAAGRAGRGSRAGSVVIQTYSPDNYAVRLGAKQDYNEFYEFEMKYRELLGYPPVKNMLEIMVSCTDEKKLDVVCEMIARLLKESIDGDGEEVLMTGPAVASIAKINDRHRKVVYLRAESYKRLTQLKDLIEDEQSREPDGDILITFDFSMIGR